LYISSNSARVALLPDAANAFALKAQYTYGNAGRNIVRADGLVQFDFTLMKQFKITDSKAVQFQAEAFNIFNNPTFSSPLTTINVASGAQVGSTLNTARTLELALEVLFWHSEYR
jgi:hypothetical protein